MKENLEFLKVVGIVTLLGLMLLVAILILLHS